ncbi:hypothetical protein [Clostridium sp.]|uniref:hypothetical protein n=1 Tax=Clostridium sp. TaxID=1506 RepID=UPI002623C30E|nr:hypothetical protein [Clostridium sp.]
MTKSNELNIDETISKAVRAAIKEYDKEQKEEQKQKVLHNTKLLMKHYNSLKLHADNAVYKADNLIDMEEYDDEDKVYISSIMRSRLRTMVMVAHIEMAMKELKEKKISEGNFEQYRSLELYYINGHSYDELQRDLNCSKNTPPRWVSIAIKDLSILLFGIDGLKLDSLG